MKKDISKIVEEIVDSPEFKRALLEQLSRKISEEYHYRDMEGELIKPKIKEVIKAEAEDMIRDLSENYFELNWKHRIKAMIKELTREEILKLLGIVLKAKGRID